MSEESRIVYALAELTTATHTIERFLLNEFILSPSEGVRKLTEAYAQLLRAKTTLQVPAPDPCTPICTFRPRRPISPISEAKGQS